MSFPEKRVLSYAACDMLLAPLLLADFEAALTVGIRRASIIVHLKMLFCNNDWQSTNFLKTLVQSVLLSHEEAAAQNLNYFSPIC